MMMWGSQSGKFKYLLGMSGENLPAEV